MMEDKQIKVEKLWGHEVWHHNDKNYCMKTLFMRHGVKSSMHMHKKKTETFLVILGIVKLEFEKGEVVLLHKGQAYTILPNQYHRFSAATLTATVVEASTYHDESDVFRIEPSRKFR